MIQDQFIRAAADIYHPGSSIARRYRIKRAIVWALGQRNSAKASTGNKNLNRLLSAYDQAVEEGLEAMNDIQRKAIGAALRKIPENQRAESILHDYVTARNEFSTRYSTIPKSYKPVIELYEQQLKYYGSLDLE
jgi:hypothetical protein